MNTSSDDFFFEEFEEDDDENVSKMATSLNKEKSNSKNKSELESSIDLVFVNTKPKGKKKNKYRKKMKNIKSKSKSFLEQRLRNEDNSVNWKFSTPYFSSVLNKLNEKSVDFQEPPKTSNNTNSFTLPSINKKRSTFKKRANRKENDYSINNNPNSRNIQPKKKKRRNVRSRKKKKRRRGNTTNSITPNPQLENEPEKEEFGFEKEQIMFINEKTDFLKNKELKEQIRVLERERLKREGSFLNDEENKNNESNALIIQQYDTVQLNFLKKAETLKSRMIKPSIKRQDMMKKNINLLKLKNQKLLDKFYKCMKKGKRK